MTLAALTARVLPPAALGGRRARYLIERNIRVSRRIWLVLFSGFFEAVFYLLAIGLGVGDLVGTVRIGGTEVPYDHFVAPALLAASSMNGPVWETSGNVFFRLSVERAYDAVLATPLTAGDIALAEAVWALVRGAVYSAAFVIVMAALGLVASPWGVLLLPGAVLIGTAFAGVGLTAVTFMRNFADLELVQLAVVPLFLFSATFVPLGEYPGWAQDVVRATPLYHGVALLRDLSLGTVGWSDLLNVLYLAALAALAVIGAGRRFARLLVR